MALENSMLVMNGKQVGGNTQDLTGYQTKVDNNLETESKEIVEAINELRSEKADTDIVAADFNAGTSYTAGNYCIYEGKFYKFKANHTGAWSAADVDEIKIAGELSALKSGLTDLENGEMTLLGKLALNDSVQLPSSYKRLYLRVNISDWFNGAINHINGLRPIIPFSVGAWACTIQLDVSNGEISFVSETTVTGTKDSAWTTYVEIYYA